MAQPLPFQQSVSVKFLEGAGLLSGLEGALDPAAKNEAEQLKRMYQEMDAERRERIAAQARGGRVLKDLVRQIYMEWQRVQQSKSVLRDTTESDLA